MLIDDFQKISAVLLLGVGGRQSFPGFIGLLPPNLFIGLVIDLLSEVNDGCVLDLMIWPRCPRSIVLNIKLEVVFVAGHYKRKHVTFPAPDFVPDTRRQFNPARNDQTQVIAGNQRWPGQGGQIININIADFLDGAPKSITDPEILPILTNRVTVADLNIQWLSEHAIGVQYQDGALGLIFTQPLLKRKQSVVGQILITSLRMDAGRIGSNHLGIFMNRKFGIRLAGYQSHQLTRLINPTPAIFQ